jgi:hypothetical protein
VITHKAIQDEAILGLSIVSPEPHLELLCACVLTQPEYGNQAIDDHVDGIEKYFVTTSINRVI